MTIFIIQYVITFLLSSLTVIKKNATKYITLFVFLILFLFAASRGSNVDRDYATYIKFFNKLIGNNLNYFTAENIAFCEPAFYFIPFFSKWLIGESYYLPLVFAVFAFLGIYFKLKSLYLSNSWFLSTILYISTFFFLHEMTQIRIGVSTGILLLSIRHIVDKNIKKFLLLILLASLFHYSSILFIIAYFIDIKSINKLLWGAIILVGYIMALLKKDLLSFVDVSFLSEKIELYMKTKEEYGLDTLNIWNYSFIINAILTLFFLFKSTLFINRNPYFAILFKLNVLSTLSFIALSSVPVFAFRISEVFGVVQYCLYPSIILMFSKKRIGYILLMIISLINFANSIFNARLFAEYHTWWSM